MTEILRDLTILENWSQEQGRWDSTSLTTLLNKISILRAKHDKPAPKLNSEFSIEQVIADLQESIPEYVNERAHNPYAVLETEPLNVREELYASHVICIGEDLAQEQSKLIRIQRQLLDLINKYEMLKLRMPPGAEG
jgi:hypothetical protein